MIFALTFSVIFESVLTILGLIILYQVFFSRFIKRKLSERAARNEKLAGAEKIAKLKLISDSTKDIETFICGNAAFISDDMINLLVKRIEYLKADTIVKDYDSTKKRIDDAAGKYAIEKNNLVKEEFKKIREGK